MRIIALICLSALALSTAPTLPAFADDGPGLVRGLGLGSFGPGQGLRQGNQQGPQQGLQQGNRQGPRLGNRRGGRSGSIFGRFSPRRGFSFVCGGIQNPGNNIGCRILSPVFSPSQPNGFRFF